MVGRERVGRLSNFVLSMRATTARAARQIPTRAAHPDQTIKTVAFVGQRANRPGAAAFSSALWPVVDAILQH